MKENMEYIGQDDESFTKLDMYHWDGMRWSGSPAGDCPCLEQHLVPLAYDAFVNHARREWGFLHVNINHCVLPTYYSKAAL